MSALITLWNKESDWRTTATNASSGAYGIGQSLPAEKMASEGADWQTNYQTQIRWGLNYIKERYGSPSAAWSFHLAHNWYYAKSQPQSTSRSVPSGAGLSVSWPGK